MRRSRPGAPGRPSPWRVGSVSVPPGGPLPGLARVLGRQAAVADYAKIFKAYDIRGIVPGELDDAAAEAIGAAFVQVTGARSVVTMHDMRTSSAPLAAAFGRGAAAQGADVIMGGLGSSDMLYFASGSLQMAGAMITASHNPARYNGLKLCTEGA